MRVREPRLSRLVFGLAFCWTGGVCPEATAQEAANVDLPKFDPSFAGDRFFGVPSPFTPSDGVANVHGGILVDYGHNPLVIATDEDSVLSCGERECSVVEHQLFLHANVTVAFVDRISVNVDMPFLLFQGGEGDVGNGSLRLQSPEGAGLGDLRFGARVRLLGDYHEPFQLGLGGYLWVPTGGEAAFVSDGSVRGQPHALVGGRADRFLWTAMAGATLRSGGTVADVTIAHQFNWGAGLGVLVLEDRTLQLGLETTGAATFENSELRNTNAEAQAGIKYRFVEFMEAGVAAGPGFTTGVGTPDFRGLFSLQYTPEPPAARDTDGDAILDDGDACPTIKGLANEDRAKHGCPADGPIDTDGDTIFDPEDACPKVRGVASDDKSKHGCPPPGDRDGDTIVDELDACIDVPGIANADSKKNGCPSDRDGDSILDPDDACPDVAGESNPDKLKHGCPPPKDTDGDGIFDDKDDCPRDKGVPSVEPGKNGCPTKLIVTDSEIIILEQVQFDVGKATIKPVSAELLDAVAQVLKDHPEILKIEVQGHTDSRGPRPSNVLLSEARAKSVVDALAKRGIERGRIMAKGYGPDKPLDPASNEVAWQKNRRVQFVVLEKTGSTQVKTR